MASVFEDAEYDSFWAAYRDCAVDATVQGAQDTAFLPSNRAFQHSAFRVAWFASRVSVPNRALHSQ
eukprot:12356143-Alexandrium_andersonii.AAC.1